MDGVRCLMVTVVDCDNCTYVISPYSIHVRPQFNNIGIEARAELEFSNISNTDIHMSCIPIEMLGPAAPKLLAFPREERSRTMMC